MKLEDRNSVEDRLRDFMFQAKPCGAPLAHRRRLPNDREGVVHPIRIGPTKIYVRTGEYEDGSLGEVFVTVSVDKGEGEESPSQESVKAAITIGGLMDAVMIAVSIGLQSGTSIETFCDKYEHTKFEPSYPGVGSSPLDAVFRYLRKKYVERSAPTAVIFREGRLLLALRPEGKTFAGVWETPGGKAERGESDEVALAREISEELGVEATVGEQVDMIRLAPPVIESRFRIPFHRVEIVGDPRPIVATRLRWFLFDEIDGIKMTPATGAVLSDRERRLKLFSTAGIAPA